MYEKWITHRILDEQGDEEQQQQQMNLSIIFQCIW